MAELTDKQEAFIEAYLANGFNATKAAIVAGYSPKTARSIGSENLTKPDISEVIQSRITALTMSANEALLRLSQHARGNLGDFLALDVDTLKAHPQAHLLHKVKHTVRYIPVKDAAPEKEERIELELYDAQAALVQILKEQHLRGGEATERSEDTVKLDLSDLSTEQLQALARGFRG